MEKILGKKFNKEIILEPFAENSYKFEKIIKEFFN